MQPGQDPERELWTQKAGLWTQNAGLWTTSDSVSRPVARRPSSLRIRPARLPATQAGSVTVVAWIVGVSA